MYSVHMMVSLPLTHISIALTSNTLQCLHCRNPDHAYSARHLLQSAILSVLDISHRGATLRFTNTNFLLGQARFVVESLAPQSANMPPLPADLRSVRVNLLTPVVVYNHVRRSFLCDLFPTLSTVSNLVHSSR